MWNRVAARVRRVQEPPERLDADQEGGQGSRYDDTCLGEVAAKLEMVQRNGAESDDEGEQQEEVESEEEDESEATAATSRAGTVTHDSIDAT